MERRKIQSCDHFSEALVLDDDERDNVLRIGAGASIATLDEAAVVELEHYIKLWRLHARRRAIAIAAEGINERMEAKLNFIKQYIGLQPEARRPHYNQFIEALSVAGHRFSIEELAALNKTSDAYLYRLRREAAVGHPIRYPRAS